MSTLRQILVATDLSPHADYALVRAVHLAAQHGARLSVLHVVESLRPQTFAQDWLWPTKEMPGKLERQLRDDAEAELKQRLATLQAGQRIGVTTETRVGTPFLEVILHARAIDADLVVVGAHGRAYMRALLFGTTAEHVIRKGDRTVLVVRRPYEQAYRRLLAAIDFSEASSGALRFAVELVPGARVELLHAYDLWYEGRLLSGGMSSDELLAMHQQYERTVRDRLEAFARDGGLEPARSSFAVRRGYPPTVITRAAEAFDLVAIGTRGSTGLRHVLLGSVAEHVLREAACDVLVTRPRATEFELP